MAQVKKKKKKQTEAQRLTHRDAVIAHADKRVRQKARNGEFEPKSDNFDGSIPIKEMPEMSLEEKVAYQEARIKYLEDYVEFQKKMPSILEEIYSSYNVKK